MSNNYQNNYFPDDSDPAGQAEYFAQIAQNSSGGGQPQITGRSDSKNCRMLTMMYGRSVDVE